LLNQIWIGIYDILLNFFAISYYIAFKWKPPLPLNGNLRNTSYMKKIPNYEL